MSEMRCPVCRAENGLDALCRRCRADLAMLAAVEQQRAACLSEAGQHLRAGAGDAAAAHAEQAHGLRAAADSAKLAALGHLVNQRFAEALRWRNRARAAS